MEDLSLHILDVAENAVRAGASEISVILEESRDGEALALQIHDNGEGMNEETSRRATDPFFTTKKGARVGLGLPLLRQAAEETGGGLRVVSGVGEGSRVTATFRCRHPDMRPVGDLCGTLAALVAGHPSVRFVMDCNMKNNHVHFDSRAAGMPPDGDTPGTGKPGH